MTFHHFLLVIHLICATIWVGGHLFLAIRLLPKALKEKKPSLILQFEKSYGKIGMPSLALLLLTGILMSFDFGITRWFLFKTPMERVISIKLILLMVILGTAFSATRFVIPYLKKNDATKLPKMAVHIIIVTLVSLGMLILGSYLRYGGF